MELSACEIVFRYLSNEGLLFSEARHATQKTSFNRGPGLIVSTRYDRSSSFPTGLFASSEDYDFTTLKYRVTIKLNLPCSARHLCVFSAIATRAI